MNKEPSETKTQTTSNAVAYQYVGSGDHLVGIPARDLTKEEFDALDKDQQAYVTKSDSYEKKGGR